MANTPKNPFTWIEIYVEDLPRARKFYETVFQIEMTAMAAPGGFGDLEMVSFPWAEGKPSASGALCKTDDFKPGSGGTLVYFACEDCAEEAARVVPAGGQLLQPKFSLGTHGFMALAKDTEGNTIGFHSNS